MLFLHPPKVACSVQHDCSLMNNAYTPVRLPHLSIYLKLARDSCLLNVHIKTHIKYPDIYLKLSPAAQPPLKKSVNSRAGGGDMQVVLGGVHHFAARRCGAGPTGAASGQVGAGAWPPVPPWPRNNTIHPRFVHSLCPRTETWKKYRKHKQLQFPTVPFTDLFCQRAKIFVFVFAFLRGLSMFANRLIHLLQKNLNVSILYGFFIPHRRRHTCRS